MDGEDVSRKTIVVLVILTLLVSVLGVLVVTVELQHKAVQPEPESSTTGTVSLKIVDPSTMAPTGRVALRIEQPPDAATGDTP